MRYSQSSTPVVLSSLAMAFLFLAGSASANDDAATADSSWEQKLAPGEWCGTQHRYDAQLAERNAAGGVCGLNGSCDDPALRDAAIPDSSTLPKIIRLSIHAFCNDNGSSCTSSVSDTANQIATLNNNYAPWKIQFVYELEIINSTQFRNYSSGEEVALKSTYADMPAEKLNIYVVDTSGFSFGTFPWDSQALTFMGGIVNDEESYGPGISTLAHEVGHCIGLWHTHHGVSEVTVCGGCYEEASGVDGDTTGDRCGDTAPTPTNFSCGPPGGTDPCSGVAWGTTDFHNYMGYAPSSCRDEFSSHQAGRSHCWIDDVLAGWLEDPDCNDNGVDDEIDISSGTSDDCNLNGIPDECLDIETDCNNNLEPDDCDVATMFSEDCNGNVIPDECELGGDQDCDGNTRSDLCDIFTGNSDDSNIDGIPDECQNVLAVYVDDDGPGDFGPGNPAVSDPLEDGTAEHPFDTIQEAINATFELEQSNPDETFIVEIVVKDGVYDGPGNRDIEFNGRPYTLRAERGPRTTIIDCQDPTGASHRGFTIDDGEGPGTRIDGFTITNCTGVNAGAIFTFLTSPTIVNCVLRDNFVNGSGGAVYSTLGEPMLRNCLIIDNIAAARGGALYAFQDSNPTLENCTLAGNGSSLGGGVHSAGGSVIELRNSIVWDNFSNEGDSLYIDANDSKVTVTFSDVAGGEAGAQVEQGGELLWAAGSFDLDPFFAGQADGGSYYLSEVASGQGVTSPCVDAGTGAAVDDGFDTMTTRTDESVDTSTVDIGYHYPIIECLPHIYGDLNDSGDLDADDLMCMLEALAGSISCPGVTFADLDIASCDQPDGDINLYDLIAFLNATAGAPACPDTCN